MEDFSSSVINTDNSISSKETAINTSQNLETNNEKLISIQNWQI